MNTIIMSTVVKIFFCSNGRYNRSQYTIQLAFTTISAHLHSAQGMCSIELLFLSEYEYTLKFRDTTAHANADALSRLPLPVTPGTSILPPELILLTKQLEDLPITLDHVRTWSRKDPVISRVICYVNKGWPKNPDPKVRPYQSRKNALSTLDGCLLRGARIVIPPQGQQFMLDELHDTHIGMTRMKSLARMYVWWPQLDRDIELLVNRCHQCQVDQSEPPKAPLQPCMELANPSVE